jgi:translation initiation factor IF-2
MTEKNTTKITTKPPVVVVMGHIDHGKSTLLDYIRKTNIVAKEAGGITQHMGAYQVDHIMPDKTVKTITFIDTPGHEAFCTIRERGAESADIAILAVSAEDGVKPQTLDALKNIKAQKLPFIVAITKIDKPNADIDRARQSLAENEIYVEGWGGDVPCIPISAIKGDGIAELLDMILLVADMNNLTTNTNNPLTGSIIESTMDSRKGISATLIIKDGTLSTGTFLVAGKSFVPVRFIENFKGTKIDHATAGMPVRIVGWTEIPPCGISFYAVKTKKEAERAVEEANIKERENINRTTKSHSTKIDAETSENQIVAIPIVIKADVIGSLDGVKYELAKIKHDKVQIKIISEGIGEINENDIKLGLNNPDVLILGFNSTPDKKASAMIERTPVNTKSFSIIYELSNYVKDILAKKIPKEYIEETTGKAKILAIFSKDKDRQVVGGKVESGTLSSGSEVKITRRDGEIGRGKIRELQTKKVRASEVAEGHEFGSLIEAKVEIAVGDRIECVITVEKKN